MGRGHRSDQQERTPTRPQADAVVQKVFESPKPKPIDYSSCDTPLTALRLALSQQPNIWRSTSDVMDDILNGGFAADHPNRGS